MSFHFGLARIGLKAKQSPQNERGASLWPSRFRREQVIGANGQLTVTLTKALDARGDGRYDVEYRVKQLDGSWRWLSAWGFVEFEGMAQRESR
jgi:hypothetical protein